MSYGSETCERGVHSADVNVLREVTTQLQGPQSLEAAYDDDACRRAPSPPLQAAIFDTTRHVVVIYIGPSAWLTPG